MAVGIARGGNDFKLSAIERMGEIGYLDYRKVITPTIRVVEGGIHIGYRSTAFLTPNS